MKLSDKKLDALLGKIKGLLAVAEDNVNEEEAQSAFVLAQRLMIKYNIDQSQIENENNNDADTIRDFGTAYKTLYWYERELATIIAENFRVKNFLNLKKHDGDSKIKKRVVFFGLEADVKIAKEMYVLANAALSFYSKRYIDRYYENNQEYRNRAQTLRIKNAYIKGFLEGLEVKLEEQRYQLQQEYGLVVLMPVVVEDKYKEIEKGFGKKGKPYEIPRINTLEESLAYKIGLEDGENIDYTKSTIDEDVLI